MQVKKIDYLFFGFVLVTTILILFSWPENILELFLTRTLIVIAVIALLYYNSKINSIVLKLVRNAYPILVSMLFYTETVFYNKLFFSNLDDYLIDLDAKIFGYQPSITFSEYFSNPLFSELMYIGYFSLYILILGFVFIAFFKLKHQSEELLFKLAATMLLFYLFFGFFPAAGPQFYFPSPEKDVPSAFIFDKIMHFIQRAEQPTGAFPSSHVGISLIILILLRKKARLFFKIAVPFVVVLLFSTVYIKAHYAIDVFGGILFTPIILYLAGFLYKKIPQLKNDSTYRSSF